MADKLPKDKKGLSLFLYLAIIQTSKTWRRAALTAPLILLLLVGCAKSSNDAAGAMATLTRTPTIEVWSTATSTSASTLPPQSTPAPTEEPATPTSTKKVEATATATATSMPEGQRIIKGAEITKFFEVNDTYEYQVSVTEGATTVESTFTWGVTPSFTRFDMFKIKTIRFDGPELPNILFKQFLLDCMVRYNSQNKTNLTLENYMKLLNQGKGKITIPGVDETKASDVSERTVITINPLDGFNFVWHAGSLPVEWGEPNTFISKNKAGKLVLMSSVMKNGAYSQNGDRSDKSNVKLMHLEGFQVVINIVGYGSDKALLRGAFYNGNRDSISLQWKPIEELSPQSLHQAMNSDVILDKIVLEPKSNN